MNRDVGEKSCRVSPVVTFIPYFIVCSLSYHIIADSKPAENKRIVRRENDNISNNFNGVGEVDT